MQASKAKILLVGPQGKMGKEAVKAINKDPELTLVATVSREERLAEVIASTDANIMVELTGPRAVFEHAKLAIDKGLHCVVGASGLEKIQIENLQKRCHEKQLGGCIIPNFSIASALMSVCSRKIAKYLKEVSIIERHHVAKVDAPSATAKHTAQQIAKEYTEKRKEDLECYYEDGVPIHSIRSSGVVAQQEVFFAHPGESLSIHHTTMERSAFMPGLIMSCRKVLQLRKMVVGLEELMKLSDV